MILIQEFPYQSVEGGNPIISYRMHHKVISKNSIRDEADEDVTRAFKKRDADC